MQTCLRYFSKRKGTAANIVNATVKNILSAKVDMLPGIICVLPWVMSSASSTYGTVLSKKSNMIAIIPQITNKPHRRLYFLNLSVF